MAKLLRPLKAIRAKCLDCSCESYKEVELCPVEDCPLYPYRFGKRPSTVQRKERMNNEKQLKETND